MSEALTRILFGTWTPPETCGPTRKNLVMKGLPTNMSEHIRSSDAYMNTEVEVLRFMREFKNRWFSPAEIHLNIKTKFSVGNLGMILREMVEDGFLLVEVKSKNKKVQLYKFNGESE